MWILVTKSVLSERALSYRWAISLALSVFVSILCGGARDKRDWVQFLSEAKEGIGSMELVSQVVVILPYGAGNQAFLQELYIP